MKIFWTTLMAFTILWTGCTAAGPINFENPDANYAWKVHDPQRPIPPTVTPGEQDHLPPSDAIILFDGKDLSAWKGTKQPDQPAPWKLGNGYIEVLPGSGDIQTLRQLPAPYRMGHALSSQGVRAGSWQQRSLFDGPV